MFKTTLFLMAISIGVQAQAQSKVYKVDLSGVKDQSERTMIQESCITEMTIDAGKNVAEQVLRAKSLAMKSAKQIQASRGSLSYPGHLEGDYLKRVYIVENDGYGAYKPAIYEAVTVTQFGARGTNELKGFEVETVLLNFTESAELAEGQICSRLTYK